MSKKRDAAYAAGGAAAGAAVMPVRTPNNSKNNPYKGLSNGVHQVPMKDVHSVSRKTGARFQNRKYTAALANHLQGKPVKPARVGVYPDGSSTQIDGAHRIWASTMNGKKTMPIKVEHLPGNRPVRPGAKAAYGAVASAAHRQRLKADQGLSTAKKTKLERGLNPRLKKLNMANATRGSITARGAAAKAKPATHFGGPGTRALRTKQGAFLAGGAAVGLGAKKLKDKLNKSAFGVDHG